ncbi:hypothetical protein [Corynebacterium sp. ES2715-CONJ3]|uniref:hypothetical protein n=1 Tax=Corynebacterium sp. ES2715-CONJ3 TaxID=2974028 RepID=UPI002168E25E|nr:hypothetical protein [Corynebacterium sp. ES2715-CONJ3]MCS4490849.1 hypothetical protein [Corynebacterium sp. ES2715-CONJ3]
MRPRSISTLVVSLGTVAALIAVPAGATESSQTNETTETTGTTGTTAAPTTEEKKPDHYGSDKGADGVASSEDDFFEFNENGALVRMGDLEEKHLPIISAVFGLLASIAVFGASVFRAFPELQGMLNNALKQAGVRV